MFDECKLDPRECKTNCDCDGKRTCDTGTKKCIGIARVDNKKPEYSAETCKKPDPNNNNQNPCANVNLLEVNECTLRKEFQEQGQNYECQTDCQCFGNRKCENGKCTGTLRQNSQNTTQTFSVRPK